MGFTPLSTVVYIFFVLLCIFLQIQTYLYIGLAFKDEKLYKCHFLGKEIFYKKELITKDAHDVVILRFKMRQSTNRRLSPSAGINLKYYIYEVHLLNEKHNNRNRIMSLDNPESAISAANFIEQHTTLFYTNL